MAQIDRDLNKVYNKIELQKAKLSKPTMSMAKIANMAKMFDQAYADKNKIAFETYKATPTEENFNVAKKTISKDSFVLPQMKDINDEMLRSLEALESKNSVNRSNMDMINEALSNSDDKNTVKGITNQIVQSRINSGDITNSAELNNAYKNYSELSNREVADGYTKNIMPAIEKLLNTKGIGTDRDALSISKEGSSNPEVQLGIYNYLKNETLSPKDQLLMMNRNQAQMDKMIEKNQNIDTVKGLERVKSAYNDQYNVMKAIIEETKLKRKGQFFGNETIMFQNKLKGNLANPTTMTQKYGSINLNSPNTYNAYGQYEDAFSDIVSMATLLEESQMFDTDGMKNILNSYVNDPSSDNFLNINDIDFDTKYKSFIDAIEGQLNNINDKHVDLYKAYFRSTDEILKGLDTVIEGDSRFQPPKEKQLVPDLVDKETAGGLLE